VTHLFLSPHYDDAAFSCGGTIYQLAQHGETVRILTVMGGDLPDPLPDTPIVRDLHQRWDAGHDPIATRRQEEQCAAKQLTANSSFLQIPDCVYRTDRYGNPCYPTEESLWYTIQANDPAVEILQKLGAGLPPVALPYDLQGSLPTAPTQKNEITLYIPLGVGDHVDHLIVRDWGITLAEHNPMWRISFYPEYPYTRDTAAIAKALSQCKLALEESVSIFNDVAMTAKINSMACYTSQISTFWQDEQSMVAEVRRQFANEQNTFTEILFEMLAHPE